MFPRLRTNIEPVEKLRTHHLVTFSTAKNIFMHIPGGESVWWQLRLSRWIWWTMQWQMYSRIIWRKVHNESKFFSDSFLYLFLVWWHLLEKKLMFLMKQKGSWCTSEFFMLHWVLTWKLFPFLTRSEDRTIAPVGICEISCIRVQWLCRKSKWQGIYILRQFLFSEMWRRHKTMYSSVLVLWWQSRLSSRIRWGELPMWEIQYEAMYNSRTNESLCTSELDLWAACWLQ